jgi:hypothetical protein
MCCSVYVLQHLGRLRGSKCRHEIHAIQGIADDLLRREKQLKADSR